MTTLPPIPDSLERALRAAPVAPVLTIDDAGQAPALAETLWSSGVRVFEVTLRTPAGLDALRAMAEAVPEAVVGVGTVASADHLRQARDAGASFAVAPGHTPDLLAAAGEVGLPLIPGVATPSEMMRAREAGAVVQKLFPAEALGGPALLRAVAEPLPEITFWPTGGIDDAKMANYLRLSNVLAIGSSRLAPRAEIARADWSAIATKAHTSLETARAVPRG
jgi:2-dehydro-3-deoxyphosphogluconate aldolase/(4S)-4-hydroxy-2-oxoglutarate aldolase